MFLIIVAIGLAVAGIITGTTAFYVLAGIVAGIVVLTYIIALAGVRAVSKKINKEFENFGNFDSSPLRVKGRRPTQRP